MQVLSLTAKQRNSETAKQRNSETAKWGELCPFFTNLTKSFPGSFFLQIASITSVWIFIVNCCTIPEKPFYNQPQKDLLEKYQVRELEYHNEITPGKTRIIKAVAEGDSWFVYPAPQKKDVIDYLNKGEYPTAKDSIFDYKIISIAKAEDTLGAMFLSMDFIKHIKKEKPNTFLKSASGDNLLDGESYENIFS